VEEETGRGGEREEIGGVRERKRERWREEMTEMVRER